MKKVRCEEKQDVFSSDKTAQTPLENDHKNTLTLGLGDLAPAW